LRVHPERTSLGWSLRFSNVGIKPLAFALRASASQPTG